MPFAWDFRGSALLGHLGGALGGGSLHARAALGLQIALSDDLEGELAGEVFEDDDDFFGDDDDEDDTDESSDGER